MKKRHAKTVLFAKNFYLQQELRGIVDYAREHGWQLEMPQMFSLRSHIRNWRGDGYLTDTGSGVEPLHDAGVRVVGLSLDPVLKRFADGIVAPDNLRIGVVAAEYFLRRGHRNFAVCTDCYGRDRAFEERIAQDGFRAVRLSMPRYFRSPQTIDLLAGKLVRLPRPCAVFCNNDWEAAAIFNAAALARRKVPEEIALIGVGNEELLCTATEPRLSSVETRLYERGFFAARMLDRMMEEGPPVKPEQLLIAPAGVIERGSSNGFAVADIRLRRLLNLLEKNAARPVRIADLARRCHFGESTFYRRCVSALGVSPKRLLVELRLGLACSRLLDSDDTIAVIAEECGFPSSGALFEQFRQCYGCTPAEWRAGRKAELFQKNVKKSAESEEITMAGRKRAGRFPPSPAEFSFD